MELTDYKVKALIYPDGEYRLDHAVSVIDEGTFYRIDGTHIIDKHKIRSMIAKGDKISITMTDKIVVLEVESEK